MSYILGKQWVRRPFVLLLPLVTLPVVLLGCERGLPEVTRGEGLSVAQLAEPAAADLLRTLVGRLTAALEEGGPEYAIEFCSSEALPLTRMVQGNLGEGLELKRTSFRYRNADNAPDEAEESALLYFEEAILDQGQAPSSYVQRSLRRSCVTTSPSSWVRFAWGVTGILNPWTPMSSSFWRSCIQGIWPPVMKRGRSGAW